MNLHRLLGEREAQGKPLRVGLIGAGKFAAMYIAQMIAAGELIVMLVETSSSGMPSKSVAMSSMTRMK